MHLVAHPVGLSCFDADWCSTDSLRRDHSCVCTHQLSAKSPFHRYGAISFFCRICHRADPSCECHWGAPRCLSSLLGIASRRNHGKMRVALAFNLTKNARRGIGAVSKVRKTPKTLQLTH